MKKILSIMMIICLMISLTSCAKCIDTKYENVEVNIIDEHYRGVWLQPIVSGKVTTFITHPARYEVIVEYNGIEYMIDDSNTYNKYKDKVGRSTVGVLEVRTYDDGTVKYDITELK